jgi:hypothetical protein
MVQNNAEDGGDSSSLANELDKALIRENDSLKQQLHEARNNTSLYGLQLEDDLKQKEEELELVNNMYERKLNDLELKTKSLESKNLRRLKKERG